MSDSRSAPKGRVPLWRWAIWWTCLGAAVVIFYVLASPIWMGLRAAAWIAEFRARRGRTGETMFPP
jgi:hypothetical protein